MYKSGENDDGTMRTVGYVFWYSSAASKTPSMWHKLYIIIYFSYYTYVRNLTT